MIKSPAQAHQVPAQMPVEDALRTGVLAQSLGHTPLVSVGGADLQTAHSTAQHSSGEHDTRSFEHAKGYLNSWVHLEGL